MDEPEIAARRLVVAGRDRSEALEPVEEDLDQVALAIQLPVELEQVPLPHWVRMDDGFHPPLAHCIDDGVGVVARVGEHCLAARSPQQIDGHGALVLLARRQRDLLRTPLGGDERVDFRRKASSRASQSVLLDPPFPPAASWWARTTEASTMESSSSSSTSTSRAANSSSQIPLSDQLRNRLYTLFHGPKRSGRSRHGTPVLARHSTASIKFRSPCLETGPVRGGSNGSIRAH